MNEELIERLRGFADPDGRIALPMIDQEGRKIGVSRRTPEEMAQVEAHVDERGTAWQPPTAWAYMAACRARAALSSECEAMREALILAEAEIVAWRSDQLPGGPLPDVKPVSAFKVVGAETRDFVPPPPTGEPDVLAVIRAALSQHRTDRRDSDG